jgi:large subunit ribosomal protein LP0
MSERLPQKKLDYRDRLLQLMRDYKKILIIGADNVGSSHFQRIRSSLRNQAVILMGKNTVVRKILRQNEKEFPQHAQLIAKMYGNLGFVFTNGDVAEIRKKILENKVGAPARIGAFAPCDVILPAGPTGLDPGQTSFLQALNIPTMIVKGQIEIKSDVDLIREGQKVTPSQAALLVKLDLRPFKYGLTVKYVYDEGAFFEAKVLDLTQEDLLCNFQRAVKNIAAISLSVGYPTIASIPHSISSAYRNIMYLSLATSYTFKGTEEIKALLDDPEALAKAMAAASGGGAAPGGAVARGGGDDDEDDAPAAPAEEEEEDLGAGGLFGDDEEW